MASMEVRKIRRRIIVFGLLLALNLPGIICNAWSFAAMISGGHRFVAAICAGSCLLSIYVSRRVWKQFRIHLQIYALHRLAQAAIDRMDH